ncbi:MAG: aspartate aminotransferase family protein [Pseudomonadota bacterium]
MIPAVMPTYGRAEIVFDRGEGPYLYATDGRRFLDFAAGIAVNSLGHCHPHVVKALADQASKLWHTSNLYRIEGQERLADRLVENTFADTVFFCNSGAEALEGSIKLMRRYHYVNGSPERYRIVTCGGAFHGRTLATISAAGNPKYLEGFGPAVDGFDHVAFGNMNELRAAIGPTTAGILVEPIQGEGGIKPADLEYLRELRKVADEFGLLLAFDEVQCGVGRTGKFFAYEWAGITPDVMAVAKGIGTGFPVGCFLATEEAAKGMVAGVHGTTFGGNPLAMAVGNAVLDIVLEPGFMEAVDKTARDFWHALVALVEEFPTVLAEVRGAGLMLGLKTVVPNTEFIAKLRDAGLLTVGAGDNVVRLLPPLTIREAEVAEALSIIRSAAEDFAASHQDAEKVVAS